MIDILMVTHIPPGMGWDQEIGLCFELQNVSFSVDKKVDVDQNCTINVFLDEQHPNGNLYTLGWGQETGLVLGVGWGQEIGLVSGVGWGQESRH